MNTYWGDIHGHSLLDDGHFDAKDYYPVARASGLDFAAITPHDIFMDQEKWQVCQNLCREHHDPGSFVTLLAYEWTPMIPQAAMLRRGEISVPEDHPFQVLKDMKLERFGHKNVYFPGDRAPFFSCTDPSSDTPAKLYKLVEKEGGLVISHHAGHWAYGIDWEAVDNRHEPVVEIYSTWGDSERPWPEKTDYPLAAAPFTPEGEGSGGFVRDALAKGFKLGVIASGDVHLKPPGAYLTGQTEEERKGDYYQGGMAAVLAENLSRESILDALRNRRYYAATGAKIELAFSINGHSFGETFSSREPLRVEYLVKGTAPLKSVELVSSEGSVFCEKGESGCDVQGVRSLPKPNRSTFYYLRVLQTDRNMAWGSPVWVEFAG